MWSSPVVIQPMPQEEVEVLRTSAASFCSKWRNNHSPKTCHAAEALFVFLGEVMDSAFAAEPAL